MSRQQTIDTFRIRFPAQTQTQRHPGRLLRRCRLRAVTLIVAALVAMGAALLPAAEANSATRAWSWHNPLPQGNALYGVWGTGSSIFAVGNAGAIVRYNGAQWVNMDSGVTSALYGVWGTSASNVYAVGTGGTIVRYDGTRWSSMSSGTPLRLRAVWGTASNNIFAVGAAGVILRYNGSTWQSMSSGTVSTLYAIWGAAANDIYAVGASGTTLHFNGASWSVVSSGMDTTLYAMWGAAANDIFAVGNGGAIYHFDGTSWQAMESPTMIALYSVWGNQGNDVYAAGLGGWLLHYDGVRWQTMTSNTGEALNAIWGSSSSRVFAVGNAGTIVRYNGTAWVRMSSGDPTTLYDVWGSSAFDFFAVGANGAVLHHDGLRWTRMTTNSQARLRGVWGNNNRDVFAVGLSGTILHYDGTTWSPMASGRTETLNAVWASSATNAFAVGATGVILHYDGNTWSPMASGTTENLNGIWGSSANNVFAVGGGGVILRYNGVAWAPLSSGVNLSLYGVWGTGPTNVYAVGLSGIILRYNGTAWTPMESGTYNIIYKLWGSGPNHIFAVTATGAILVCDGATWSSMVSGTASALYGIWGSSGGDVFAVGLGGTILHYGGGLALQKTVTPVSAPPGHPVTFTLTYSNTGAIKASQVYLTDTIPISFTVTGVQSTGAVITNTLRTPPYVWQIADLPANAGGIITVTATLSPGLPAGDVIENGAIIAGSGDLWSSATVDVAVDKAASTTTLATPPAATVFGQPVMLTATVGVNLPSVGKATGAVRFMKGSTLLGTATLDTSGIARLTANGLAIGSNPLTAEYDGDENVEGSASPPLPHTVDRAQTAISLFSSPSPSVLSENVTFTLRVTAKLPGAGTPSGTVTMTVAGATLTATLAGGQATFTKSDLALATHVVTGTYGGDGNFLAAPVATYSHSVKCLGTVTNVNDSGAGSLRNTFATVCPDAVIDFAPALAGQTILLTTGAIESTRNATIRDLSRSNITIGAGSNGPIFRVPVGGALTLQHLHLADTTGGAVQNRGTLQVYDVTFRQNDATLGGAIYSTGTLTVTSAVFLTNTAQSDGGAIAIAGAEARTWIRNSTFVANDAVGNGGAVAGNGTVVIANSTFAANDAANGAALYTSAGAATLFNASLSGNGLANNTGATTTLYNSIVTGTPGCTGAIVDGGFNLDSGNSCSFDVNKGSQTNATPLWAGPGDFGGFNQTLALLPGSPAIDAGELAICAGADVAGSDQRGVDRMQHSPCDIGAFESQGFTMTVAGDEQQAMVFGAFAQPLVATVTGAPWQGKLEPVDGGAVLFTTPASAASATLAPAATVTLAGGQATVTATANGDVGAYAVGVAANGAGSGELNLENVLWPSTTTLQAARLTGRVGETFTFTATVTSGSPGPLGAPAGQVVFADEQGYFETAVPVANGVAVLAFNDLGPETYHLAATYLGSDVHSASASSPVTVTISKLSTTTEVEASTTTPTPGQLVHITATVTQQGAVPPSGLPSGFVDLRIDGVLYASKFLHSGVVTTTFQTTTMDSFLVIASYPGDGANKASFDSLVVTVGKRATSTALQASLNPSREGDEVTFTATINAFTGESFAGPRGAGNYPTGTILFTSDGVEIGRAFPSGAVGAISTSHLPPGTHDIVASYLGDERFGASESEPLVHTVQPLPIAVNDAAGVLQDRSVTVPVVANDLDPAGGGLTIVGLSAHGFGTAVIAGNAQSIVYTPNPGFNGVDLVEYTVEDVNHSQDTALLTVVVADREKTDRAPEIIPINPKVDTMLAFTNTHTRMLAQLPAGFYTGTVETDEIFFLSYTPVITATPNTGMPPGTLVFGNFEFELEAFLNGTLQVNMLFGAPVTFTITYDPQILGELDEGTVSLYYWNGTSWSNAGITILDRSLARHQIIVAVNHLTQFAFFVSAPTAAEVAPEPDAAAHLYLPVLQVGADQPGVLLEAPPEPAPAPETQPDAGAAPVAEIEEPPPDAQPAADEPFPALPATAPEAAPLWETATRLYLPAVAVDGDLAPAVEATVSPTLEEAAFRLYLVVVQP